MGLNEQNGQFETSILAYDMEQVEAEKEAWDELERWLGRTSGEWELVRKSYSFDGYNPYYKFSFREVTHGS